MFYEKELEPKIYKSKIPPKANVFYFHGGGLIFGTKEDLPQYHIDRITGAGYNIYSFDYPLAPETKLPEIMDIIIQQINIYAKKTQLPYFLWGRSAGAYLCLLAPLKELGIRPQGIISYYGYGLMNLDWYEQPNRHYLQYQKIDKNMTESLIQNKRVYNYPVYPRFLLYLYIRQKGNWIEYIYHGAREDFIKDYSLKNKNLDDYPPVFLAHGLGDKDVPFEESMRLSENLKDSILYSFNSEEHDFDKAIDNKNTIELLDKTIVFLDKNTAKDVPSKFSKTAQGN